MTSWSAPPGATVDSLIAECPQPQREVAAALRALIRAVAPELDESVKWGKPCYGRGKAGLFSIVPHARHVNLQVFNGATLADPDGLLEGTGKGLRHVKCRTVDDVQRPALRRLLADALAAERVAP